MDYLGWDMIKLFWDGMGHGELRFCDHLNTSGMGETQALSDQTMDVATGAFDGQ